MSDLRGQEREKLSEWLRKRNKQPTIEDLAHYEQRMETVEAALAAREDTERPDIERWLELQIQLTESQVAEMPDDLPGKPMSSARASYAGVAYGLKLALEYSRNGLATVTYTTSVLVLPCGRVIGTEAPMPDGIVCCSCGQVHPRQKQAEVAAPWMVTPVSVCDEPDHSADWKRAE
jgi:hypothetical protein